MSELPPEKPTVPERVEEDTIARLAMDDVLFAIDSVKAGIASKDALKDARQSLDMAAESLGLPPDWRSRHRTIGSRGGKISKKDTGDPDIRSNEDDK